MAIRFRVRRSDTFAGAQNTIPVAYSEIAYITTAANNPATQAGHKLYIGTGTPASEVNFQASAVECIGGSYYTQLLDTVPGVPTASSALLLDANSRVNSFNIASAGAVNYFNTANTFSVGLKAPTALAASYALTLPGSSGTSGQYLQTDGTGVTSWASINTTSVALNPSSATAYQLTDGSTVYFNINDITGSENITLGNALTTQTYTIKDNTASAYQLKSGANTYFNIDTTTATSLTTIPFGNVKITNDLEVTSGNINTTAATANLVNTVATTVNLAGAATAVNIGAATGTTTVNNNLTVTGNLIVYGSNSQVNTTNLSITDALIDLGRVNGAAPTTNTGLDLGLRLNYFSTTSKIASLFYKNASARFVLSTNVTESTGTLAVTNPTSTVNDYSGLELGSLYINDFASATLGTAEPLVNYTTVSGIAGRYLQNVIIDCGTF